MMVIFYPKSIIKKGLKKRKKKNSIAYDIY